jgi:hypothetical protein
MLQSCVLSKKLPLPRSNKKLLLLLVVLLMARNNTRA